MANLALFQQQNLQQVLNLAGVEIKDLPSFADDLVAGMAENTQATYLSVMRRFRQSGYTFPADADSVADYIRRSELGAASLNTHIAALSFWHRCLGFPDPTAAIVVEAAMRRLRRERGVIQKMARPLTQAFVINIADMLLQEDSLKAQRDLALLLVGFSGAFRRSELCQLEYQDLLLDGQFMILTLRHSKTDQEGKQFRKLIFRASKNKQYCPVRALVRWLDSADISEGRLFRGFKPGGKLRESLSDKSVDNLIKHWAKQLNIPNVETPGVNPVFSGHSFRAGFITTCRALGMSNAEIRKISGHKSDRMIDVYDRDTQLRENNPTAKLW